MSPEYLGKGIEYKKTYKEGKREFNVIATEIKRHLQYLNNWGMSKEEIFYYWKSEIKRYT